jgi:hypothetical protein
MAVLGQKSPAMALHYCREAEKAKLASNAMARLQNGNTDSQTKPG